MLVVSMLPTEAVDRYKNNEISEEDFIATMLYWAIELRVIIAILYDEDEEFDLVTLH